MAAVLHCRRSRQVDKVAFFMPRIPGLYVFAVFCASVWILAFGKGEALAGMAPPGEAVHPRAGEVLFLASLPGTFSPRPFENSYLEPRLSTLTVPANRAIQRYIDRFRGPWHKGFQESLERAWPYLPIIMEILDVYGVPTDLAYVVMVESRFRKKARSYRGAAGFWQLMPATARFLGLRVDWWVDERLDPVKATQAAAKHLRDLHDQFGSWPLALAAYNAGAGAVRRAIRRCHSNDFWTLCRKRALPRQTRGYVAKIYAAVRICRDPQGYGFHKPRFMPVFAYTTIWVRSPLTLRQVARWIGSTVRDLRKLNPALRKDRIPPGSGYALRLPPAAVERFLVVYERHLSDHS